MVSSNFVDTYIVIKCYQFEVQKVGYFCNNFVTIEMCIMLKMDSVESQNKKNKNEILYRWYEYSVEVKK